MRRIWVVPRIILVVRPLRDRQLFYCPVKLLSQAHALAEKLGEQKGKFIMKEQLLAIRKSAEEKLASLTSLQELEDVRVGILGKKGELTQVLRQMGGLSAEERPVIGQLANDVRSFIETKIEEQKAALSAAKRKEQ